MTTSSLGFLILLAAVTVESFAQLFLKVGASRAATRLTPGAWVALGVAAYVLEILLYTLALQRLEVSAAFPFGGLCFVGVALLSRVFLGESVGKVRWLGVGCIVAGASILAL